MKQILFPFEIDNPIYKEAYVYAVKFARNLNTQMILLNTFIITAGNDITKDKYSKLIRNKWFKAYNEVSKLNKYYLEEHARTDNQLIIKFDYRFINGTLKEEIKNVAREDAVGLIVLPVSDRKEMNKRQLEIIHDNLFEKNRVSLLVIPFKGVFKPINNIVFLTDLKKLHHFTQYLNNVIQCAEAFDSNIHFVNISSKESDVNQENSEVYQEIMKITNKNPRYVYERLIGNNVIESVNQYVENNNADLLVAIKHQHYFLETLFHKSITDEISLNSKVPVLIMREIED
ncbi:universal stress protein [Bacteroidota bacterium]